MAKIEFNPNSPVQSLSGTAGRLIFRTRNGKTTVFSRPTPEMPKNATPAQKKAFRKRQLIDECTDIIQSQISDLVEAIEARHKIREAMRYLYDKYAPENKARHKLKKAMLEQYQKNLQLNRSNIEVSSRVERD